MSFNKKNNTYILIKPSHENIINYKKSSLFSTKNSCPQVFHGARFPYLHSIKNLFYFIIRTRKSLDSKSIYKEELISYTDNIGDYIFDFGDFFSETINRYKYDTKLMDKYIDRFWNISFTNFLPKMICFSMSPVHLDSYFLINKIKSISGKVATHQHGGFYCYTEEFLWRTIPDHTLSDYFLSFGKTDLKNLKLIRGFDNKLTPIETGSNVVAKPKKNINKIKASNKSCGIYIPPAVSNFTTYPIDKKIQFMTAKNIVDLLGSFNNEKTIIKGIKRYNFHEELMIYVKKKSYVNIFHITVSLMKALEKKPKFIILDCASTPLLQVLANYTGPVFLLLNQPPEIKNNAMRLLKERVIISKSTSELKAQLNDYFLTGNLKNTNIFNNSFSNIYLKPFKYDIFEEFINKI